MSNNSDGLDDKDVQIVSRSLAHDGFLRVENIELRHRLFSGGWSEVFLRELQLRAPAVGVLLFDPVRDELVLVRQFRIGLFGEDSSSWPLEIVAGMVGQSEELEDVARRESSEESNCLPTDLVRICEYYNSPGATNEKITLFCGRVDSSNAGGVYGLNEEHEDIKVEILGYGKAIEMLEAGKINNAMTIVSLQWLQLHREALLKLWEKSR